MGNETDTYGRIIGIIADTLEIDEKDLTEETRFEDLSADSFDMLEMVTAIEDAFDMEVPEEALEDFKTVGDVVEAIEEG